MIYSISFFLVTAKEVEAGIINSNEAKLNSFVLFRDFENVQIDANNSKILEKFIEMNEAKKEQLNSLRSKVESKLPVESKHYFKIDWLKANNFEEDDKSKNSKYTDHVNEYLKEFGDKFKTTTISLLGKTLKQDTFSDQIKLKYYQEILHHARYCNELLKYYYDRPDLIIKVCSYQCIFIRNLNYI